MSGAKSDSFGQKDKWVKQQHKIKVYNFIGDNILKKAFEEDSIFTIYLRP